MERISHMDMTKPAIEMREIVKKFGDFTANDHVICSFTRVRFMQSLVRMELERVHL